MRGGGNMQQMMKQMQKMQKKMAQEQEKLKEERVAGTAGGGMVTVTVTGHKEVVDVEIKEELTYCSVCGHITENDPCYICEDKQRDR